METTRPSRPRSGLEPVVMLKLVFLAVAFVSFLLSVYLYFVADEKTAGIFVGIWVPSIHSLGALLLSDSGGLR
ncbi:MAG: hypothetical protein SGJ13_14160 [Actinomycetota bacterium]|nr:hypothetical protein [Actinomycetota bacterium]